MGKQTFQRRTIARIQEVAPNLRFVAFYHGGEERLNSCMLDYGDRSFVYILSSCYEDKEYFLYVGKSKASYSRFLNHTKKYAYSHMYLLECDPEYLTDSEKAVIRELTPIFNRKDNPEAGRIGRLLSIDYNAIQSEEAIESYLRRYSNYKKMGLFGFALPVVLYTAMEEEAFKAGCTCGEWVSSILEQTILQKQDMNLDHVSAIRTNLVTTKEFGNMHNKSQEQVKQYLHQQERMPGSAKIGRDWIVPYDMKYPENLRGKPGKQKEEGDAQESQKRDIYQ